MPFCIPVISEGRAVCIKWKHDLGSPLEYPLLGTAESASLSASPLHMRIDLILIEVPWADLLSPLVPS